MKTENEMEDLLRGLRLETPRELDENILKDAFAVLTEAAASESVAPEKPPSRRATPRFLKFLFGTSLRKIAVAGATCAACVALLILFGMNRTSLPPASLMQWKSSLGCTSSTTPDRRNGRSCNSTVSSGRLLA